MERQLCIRFDVDTPVCANPGIPILLDLADEFDAKFTFFCNMGRSVSIPTVLKKRFSTKKSHTDVRKKLSSTEKLGFYELARTVFLNPKVGASNLPILKNATSRGHEIGLHGGINHSTWHHSAMSWEKKRIEEEIQWGLDYLAKAEITGVQSFASPGWTSPEFLPKVLVEKGFKFLCDVNGLDGPFIQPSQKEPALKNVRTNIVGLDGTGYLEETAVTTKSQEEIQSRFKRDLENAGNFAMMYDHPCFAARGGLELLKIFLKVAQELGFTFVTVSHAAEVFSND